MNQRQRATRLANALGMEVTLGTDLRPARAGSRWWLVGCKGGDVVLPLELVTWDEAKR